VLQLSQVTLVPSHLEATAPDAPAGAVHCAVVEVIETDDGETYTGRVGDSLIKSAAIANAARALFAACAEHLAHETAQPVRATADKSRPLVDPDAR
jgi:hypothetical protein